MRKHLIPGTLAALLAASNLAAAQQAPQPTVSSSSGAFSLTTGVDYSTGKYGTASSTDILYVPITGRYDMDKWSFKLTVPFISITGPGNVVRGVGVLRNKPARARRTEEGLGDVVAGVTRNLLDLAGSGTLVDVTGKIKFGTADAGKGLGTGENDYAVQIDVAQVVTPRISVFGSLGYKFVGSPSGADLHNAVYAEGGGTFKVNEALHAGLILDVGEAVGPSGPQRELTAYLSQQFTERWKLQLYGVHGFANGSPDWAGGAMATFRF